MVQAADVGVRLVADNKIPEEPASTKQTVDFLKQLRGKIRLHFFNCTHTSRG
jgi:hypothetical protein